MTDREPREAIGLLVAAITEVSESEQSMSKLARAAATRPNCESEWVYEIDGTQVLTGLGAADVAREVSFGQRRRADMRILRTLVEFKSTKPWYAESGGLQIVRPPSPPLRGSAQKWLGPDIARMAAVGGTVLKSGVVAEAGIFALLISTDGEVGRGEFATHEASTGRLMGLERYERWLGEYANLVRAGATITNVSAGQGSYRGMLVSHDVLIVSWPEHQDPAK